MRGRVYLKEVVRKLEVEQVDSDEDLSYAEQFLRVSSTSTLVRLPVTQRVLE